MYNTPGIEVLPIPGEKQYVSLYVCDIFSSRIIFPRRVFAASVRFYEAGSFFVFFQGISPCQHLSQEERVGGGVPALGSAGRPEQAYAMPAFSPVLSREKMQCFLQLFNEN